MKIDIKKDIIDPIKNEKIDNPTAKEIVLLKENDTYEEYNELRNEQKEELSNNIVKIIVPAILGLIALGISTWNYASARIKNKEYNESAELLINEAQADSMKKE